MRTPRILTALTCLTLVAGAALARDPALAGGRERDPFEGALFRPELVMLHADEIGLDEGQKAAIKGEINETQPLFVDRQFELQSRLGKLRRLLEPATVDEAAVLEVLDQLLALERDIKRAQVGLLVRIKNLLRPEQQQRLAALRGER